jgi:hypothetical protein
VDKSGHDQRIQQLTDIERNRIKDSKLPSVNTTSTRRANAAFVILARNSDLWEILFSIRGMEGARLFDPLASASLDLTNFLLT